MVATSLTCSFNAAGIEIICQGPFTDTLSGTGTVTQTTRFTSRDDIIDEATTNPPLTRSLGTTTVTSLGGVAITLIATNSYDNQRRLLSTALSNSVSGPQDLTYNAWDSAGRPTTGSSSSFGITFPISLSYNDANRTMTRELGGNTCIVTHDQNGIIIREACTGTTPSTTDVTVLTTLQICR